MNEELNTIGKRHSVNVRECRNGDMRIEIDGTAYQLSPQQLAAMRAVSIGLSPSVAIVGREHRTGEAWTASQRASVSRTLRRLRSSGLIDGSTLTDVGRLVLSAINPNERTFFTRREGREIAGNQAPSEGPKN